MSDNEDDKRKEEKKDKSEVDGEQEEEEDVDKIFNPEAVKDKVSKTGIRK